MIHHIFLSMLFCLAFASCGRKQRTIFQFNEQESIRISKLALPAVQALRLQPIATGIALTWQALATPIIYKHPDAFLVELLGYHVFKLSKNSFIPKKPLTKYPIKHTTYVDQKGLKTKNKACYLVRPVFKIQDQIIVGISSQIVCTS